MGGVQVVVVGKVLLVGGFVVIFWSTLYCFVYDVVDTYFWTVRYVVFVGGGVEVFEG